jgi:hypothetical protein
LDADQLVARVLARTIVTLDGATRSARASRRQSDPFARPSTGGADTRGDQNSIAHADELVALAPSTQANPQVLVGPVSYRSPHGQ